MALALGGLASGDFLVAAKVLGVAAVVLAACFTWCVTLDLVGDWRFAFIAGLLVVGSPRMVSQGLGGTEAAWAALWSPAAATRVSGCRQPLKGAECLGS